MNDHLYTVSQAAELLQLHEKTVQRFIREGKIKASKVGRSYRINGHELSLFSGDGKVQDKQEFTPDADDLREAPAASAVVDCYVGGKDEAMRISNTLNAVMNSKLPEEGTGRVDFIYYEEERKGKIVLFGQPLLVSRLLQIVDQLLKKWRK